jgi:hypothetical protein
MKYGAIVRDTNMSVKTYQKDVTFVVLQRIPQLFVHASVLLRCFWRFIVFSCFVIICKQSAEYFTVSGKSFMWQILDKLPYDFAKAYDVGLQTDIATLDFSKAFDTVSTKLLSKMGDYGIPG